MKGKVNEMDTNAKYLLSEAVDILKAIVADYGEVISGQLCENAADIIAKAEKAGE